MEKALMGVKAVHPDGFGAFDRIWLPYSTMLLVLTAVLVVVERAPRPGQAYKDVKCWYWGSVFLERYASAVESKAYRDAMDPIRRQTEPDFRPEVPSDIKRLFLDNGQFRLQGMARVNSVYRKDQPKNQSQGSQPVFGGNPPGRPAFCHSGKPLRGTRSARGHEAR